MFRLTDDETQFCDTGCHTHVYEEHHQCHHHLKQQVTQNIVHTVLVNDYTVYATSEFFFYFFFFPPIYRRKTVTMRTSPQPYLVRRGTGKMFIPIEIYCLHSSQVFPQCDLMCNKAFSRAEDSRKVSSPRPLNATIKRVIWLQICNKCTTTSQ